MRGQLAHRGDHRGGHGLGGVIDGQVQQDGEPGGLRSPECRSRWCSGAQDQIAFPVPGHGAVGGLGWAVADGEHVGCVHPRRPRRATDLAGCALGGQALVQIGAQTGHGLHVQRLIDRLVAHRTGLSRGDRWPTLGDQLRAPPLVHPRCDRRAQRVGELNALGRHAALHARCATRVIVTTSTAVPPDLARDRRAVASEPPGDLALAEAGVEAPRISTRSSNVSR